MDVVSAGVYFRSLLNDCVGKKLTKAVSEVKLHCPNSSMSKSRPYWPFNRRYLLFAIAASSSGRERETHWLLKSLPDCR
jgi:hypothetical protein